MHNKLRAGDNVTLKLDVMAPYPIRGQELKCHSTRHDQLTTTVVHLKMDHESRVASQYKVIQRKTTNDVMSSDIRYCLGDKVL